MFENGFDAGYVIRHPVFLVTFIIAIPAWIVAFAGQCAAEAQYTSQSRPSNSTLPHRFTDPSQPDQIDQWPASYGSVSGSNCKTFDSQQRARLITVELSRYISCQYKPRTHKPRSSELTLAQLGHRYEPTRYPSLPARSRYRHRHCICCHWCRAAHLLWTRVPYRCGSRLASNRYGRRE